ncbi:MAG TPA: YybS family protein [Desulfuromonadales bacterium]|nr:YybS family protein [Desulfuromonadales bacterium]
MDVTSQAGHATAVRLKAALLGMVGSFILFAAYLAVPPVGMLTGIFTPFPAAYTRIMYGRLPAFIVMLGAATAITLLFGVFAGTLFLGMSAITGFVLPELLLRGISGSRSLFVTTAINVVVLAVAVVLYSATSGLDLQQFLSAEISNSLKQAIQMYEKGGVKGEDLELVKQTMQTVAALLQRLYPALITIMLIIISICNLALLKKTTATSTSPLAIDEFNNFKNPDLMVWVVIASGFILLAPDQLISTIALNILLVVSVLYFFQGMAVVKTVIERQALAGILRIGLYVMLIFQPYLAAFVAAIGLCDLWVDFRTPKKQENL